MPDRTLRLAHSPDADDLVMWWPLVGLDGEGPRVDTGGFSFELIGRDVEELNKLVAGNRDDAGDTYDITAISCAAYPAISDRYAITDCGGSFGEGYGPKLVVREDDPRFAHINSVESLDGAVAGFIRDGATVAIPGETTTAFLTLRLIAGEVRSREMPFMEIIGAIGSGEVDAGMLIHEAQLTFADQGLRAVLDVGAWWGANGRGPLPLGLNVVRRDLDSRFGSGTVAAVSGVLSASVEHAMSHIEDCRSYLLAHAERTGVDRPEWRDTALLSRYLSMYVSGLTRSMGKAGREAIERLLSEGHTRGYVADPGPIDIV